MTPSAVPRTAILPAAGYGTRLRSDSNDMTPKCLRSVRGRPFVSYALAHLAAAGVKQVVINLHYGADAVTATLGDGSQWGLRIVYLREEHLLGTAGTVRAALALAEPPFLVWYADNFSLVDVAAFADRHTRCGAAASISVVERGEVSASGVVTIDASGRVTDFTEKPSRRTGPALVNAGIYLVEGTLVSRITAAAPVDFGRDVFPESLAAGVHVQAYTLSPAEGLWWIDTPADLARVDASFPEPART